MRSKNDKGARCVWKQSYQFGLLTAWNLWLWCVKSEFFKIIHYLSWKTCLQEKTTWSLFFTLRFQLYMQFLPIINTFEKSYHYVERPYVLVIFKNIVFHSFSWWNPLNLANYFYNHVFHFGLFSSLIFTSSWLGANSRKRGFPFLATTKGQNNTNTEGDKGNCIVWNLGTSALKIFSSVLKEIPCLDIHLEYS